MILIAGISADACLQLVASRLEQNSLPYIWLDEKLFASSECMWQWNGNALEGSLITRTHNVPLSEFRSVYMRMDGIVSIKPDVTNGASGLRIWQFQRAFARWIDIAPMRVITRYGDQASNSSKPY
jgi:hypothetical protein